MGKENLSFGNMEMEKSKIYCHRDFIFLKDIDDEKVLVSNKISLGETNCKYFIGYLYNDNKIRPLHIRLPKTSTYVKRF